MRRRGGATTRSALLAEAASRELAGPRPQNGWPTAEEVIAGKAERDMSR